MLNILSTDIIPSLEKLSVYWGNLQTNTSCMAGQVIRLSIARRLKEKRTRKSFLGSNHLNWALHGE